MSITRTMIKYKNVQSKRTNFTGQEVDESDIVICPTCGLPVSLRVAWIDRYTTKYQGKEVYVHYKCLSQERLKQIQLEMEEREDQCPT